MTDYIKCEWKDVPKDLQPGDQLIINGTISEIIEVNPDDNKHYYITDHNSYSINVDFNRFNGYRRKNMKSIVDTPELKLDIKCPYCGYNMKVIEDDSGIYFKCTACRSQSPKSENLDPDAAIYLAQKRSEDN